MRDTDSLLYFNRFGLTDEGELSMLFRQFLHDTPVVAASYLFG